MAGSTTPTKKELQETLDDISDRVSDLLDPSLSREDVVKGLQEIDEILSGDDDEDEEEDDDTDDGDTE